VAFLEESIRRDPDVAIPYANLATIFGETGRLAEAAPVVKKLLALEPRFSARAWCANHPFRDPSRRKREAEALVRAGVPA
jgi:hypothetical protein